MTKQRSVRRSTFLSTSAALLGASLVNNIPSARAEEVSAVSSSGKPSIVFCHGIWADGSSFSRVIPPLQAAGYDVMAAQYGLDTAEGDVATVIHTMNRLQGPVILVGHSYGGSVITAAGMDPRVVGLVYIAALAPDVDAGETSASTLTKYPPSPVFQYVQPGDGRLWLVPDGVNAFCQDLSPADQKLVWATHYAPDANLFNKNAPGTAWKTKPSWYIVAKNDKTIQPDLERYFAKRMNAKVTEADSSHVIMLSKPQLVVDVILEAAKTKQTAAAGA
jgi:pimeloyl-ACP methyl ester carboxylesterase